MDYHKPHRSEIVDQITTIHKSLTIFVCGLIGVAPVVGLPFGLAAIGLFISARRKRSGWNPAEHYLDWGVRFALLGFILTLLLVALLMAISTTQSS